MELLYGPQHTLAGGLTAKNTKFIFPIPPMRPMMQADGVKRNSDNWFKVYKTNYAEITGVH